MLDGRLASTRAETGAFTAARAWQAGFSATEVRRRIRCGEWVQLRRGVYAEASVLEKAAAHADRRHALDVAALLLALQFEAVGGGTPAAQIWGFDLMVPPPRSLVVVSDAAGIVARRRRDHIVRVAALPAGHRAVRCGVPVTSAARTAVDLARELTFVEGVVVVDSALRSSTTSVPELQRVLDFCRSWPGVRQAERALAFADGSSESVLESISRVAMHEQGITPPRTQVVIGDARVDFRWDDVRVVGEADGLGKYEPTGGSTTREIVRAEKRREERLADAGFEVVRWGWADARNPPRLAHRLWAAFARGAERQRGRAAG